MILSPLSNSPILLTSGYGQKRPVITQGFAERPSFYSQFGLEGHDGIDLRAKEGTPIYAPFEGIVKIRDSGILGYGKHVRIFKDNLELVLGHLSKFAVKDNQKVYMGELLGYSGNTGVSSAPHLHIGVRNLSNNKILNYDNGYFGYIDCADLFITFKGTLTKTDL